MKKLNPHDHQTLFYYTLCPFCRRCDLLAGPRAGDSRSAIYALGGVIHQLEIHLDHVKTAEGK